MARWRVIGNPIMAIPLFIWLYLLQIAFGIVTFIAWFAILFTGKFPESMFDFCAGVMRYQWRVSTFYLFMREPYPTFSVVSTTADPGDDQATFSITYPEKLSRGLIFIKWLLVIPVFIVLFVYGIGALIALIVAFFTVLITGKYPESWKSYLIRVMRLGYRANAYYNLMTDVYPGFSIQE
ncbi:MAG TPA: DUF4389 domain-containing protein [Acidimicrobiales bacterium]|nr:DUF4389 domain-containing protein [Acidimicrobiales bacterium]